MTFNVKIVMQPFEVSFEAGSIAEAVSILSDPENEIAKLAALATDTSEEAPETSSEPAAEPKKRGRKAKAAVEAVAPAPIPVPSAPAAPVDTTPGASGIPAFLDRTAQAPAPVAVAPPPPVAPAPVVAAPAAPPPPPVGVLGPKVIAELNRRKEGQPDGGAGLIAWVASAGLIVPSATWDEMTACLQFLDDAKLGPVAAGLQIS